MVADFHPGHPVVATGQAFDRRLQHFRGHAQHLLAHFLRGLLHRAAGNDGGAGCVGPHVERRRIRVARGDDDLVEAHAEGFRGDLGEHGVRPAAHVGSAHLQKERAVLIHLQNAEAQSMPAIPLPCMVQAMPTPRFKWPAAGNALRLLAKPMAAAARSMHSGRLQLRTTRGNPSFPSPSLRGKPVDVAQPYDILAVKLDGVDAQFVRDFVHQGFLREESLRAAIAAERAGYGVLVYTTWHSNRMCPARYSGRTLLPVFPCTVVEWLP